VRRFTLGSQWIWEAKSKQEAGRQALAAVDLEPLGASLALWADADEEDLGANLGELAGFPPIEDLDVDAIDDIERGAQAR
jgi:hypothetical protein